MVYNNFVVFYRFNQQQQQQHHVNNSSWHNIIESGFNGIKIKDSSNINKNNDEIIHINPEWDKCIVLENSQTNITTIDEYSKFDFQPEWMKTKEYWDKTFETRYEKLKQEPERPPLKVCFHCFIFISIFFLFNLNNYFT